MQWTVQLMLATLCNSCVMMMWVGAGRTSIELNGSLNAGAEPLFSNATNPAFMLSFHATPAAASRNSSSSNLYLCISFVVHDISVPGQCVWTANRDAPVTHSASLKLTASGNLVLSASSSTSFSDVWESQTSGLHVKRLLLLNSGNLVLVNSSDSYVWQSFFHPTDTLLPGQDLTPQSAPLISNLRTDNFASGLYSLSFYPSQTLVLSRSGDSIHPFWAAWVHLDLFRFDERGNVSLYNSSSSISSNFDIANDYGILATRRMTLDVDGNLRMYTWNETSAIWINVWKAFQDVCAIVAPQGLCGSYGVCAYNPIQPTCMCPQGFRVVDPTDLSKGCEANFKISDCTSFKYVELENVNYPFNDLSRLAPVSLEECKNSCTNSCNCMAAVYRRSRLTIAEGSGVCWLKSKAENGYTLASQELRVFLKISTSDPLVSNDPIMDTATGWSPQNLYSNVSMSATSPKESCPHQSSNKFLSETLAVVIGILALCLAGTVAALISSSRRHIKYMKLHKELEGSSPLVCSYEELRVATQNFSHQLGAGGFSTVYKGQLQSGQAVAVKQLEGISQLQEKQFRAEIMTIGRIHHINLLRLVGFCSEGAHRLLVYDYMEKGSLDQLLFQNTNKDHQQTEILADWTKRFQICLGVARGLHYLHEECLDSILHCDIKPQNILLDGSFSPKVADFGLAYLYSRDHTVKMTTIRGTRGYLAPEWISNLPITSKADVYSYGMLILEIVSGRSNYLFSDSAMEGSGRWCFPNWAYGKRVEDVMDTRLDQHSVDLSQVEAVIQVGFACIQPDMNARPSVGKVVQMLEGTLPILDAPPPAVFPEDFPSPISNSAPH